ncbi:hypothetical protein F4813DRAFT_374518 [Daldinia decipiens]|uniref:uncharacterized protein n=1 Tax=Daldinia decipiens TaxID=326647 RepID=UPI0020C5823A|nr:uncharacterized protein F4813DRAFT_374518 [Daldinia decipiens]KAI1653376.1 hypothetical protein F4813DRAFT_374518 [Daldinia decipiens]
MPQLPAGTIGDAVGVLLFTFICLFTNILLIWLYWISHERLSYVALIAYFALLCTMSSIVQQIYNYTLWNDLMWAQLYYIKANYENADVIFNNGNFGFMRALAIIRLFCYIIESSYLMTYSIHMVLTIYGYWGTRRSAERVYTVASRIVPFVLDIITIGLLQTPAVQRSFFVYMVVANVQAVGSCAVGIIAISVIVWKYVNTKLSWKYLPITQHSRRWSLPFRNSMNSDNNSGPRRSQVTITLPSVFDSNWLVFRLFTAIILISAFIVASIVTHLPQRDDVARDAQADQPDLSAGRARSNIIGYIYGVTPGLAIWIVFGLTRTFREIMYERLVPRRWRTKQPKPLPSPGNPWNASHEMHPTDYISGSNMTRAAIGAEYQLNDMHRAKGSSSSELRIKPLPVSNLTSL